MTERILSKEERLRLKAQSHHLDPTVLVGGAGLSEAVVREIDRALNAHGLIKVRGPASPRDERECLFSEIAQRLQAARIQLIGRLMVLFRPIPPAQPAVQPRAGRAASAAGAPRPGKPARTGAKGARSGAARSGGLTRASGGKVGGTLPLGRSLKRSERAPPPQTRGRSGRTRRAEASSPVRDAGSAAGSAFAVKHGAPRAPVRAGRAGPRGEKSVESGSERKRQGQNGPPRARNRAGAGGGGRKRVQR
jgi:putative YhbY family RNA-binding protein